MHLRPVAVLRGSGEQRPIGDTVPRQHWNVPTIVSIRRVRGFVVHGGVGLRIRH